MWGLFAPLFLDLHVPRPSAGLAEHFQEPGGKRLVLGGDAAGGNLASRPRR